MTNVEAVHLPCRITIDCIEHIDEPYYAGECTCGVVLDNYRMPAEILEAAYEHFVNVPHRGFMFIDFRKAKDWTQ